MRLNDTNDVRGEGCSRRVLVTSVIFCAKLYSRVVVPRTLLVCLNLTLMTLVMGCVFDVSGEKCGWSCHWVIEW